MKALRAIGIALYVVGWVLGGMLIMAAIWGIPLYLLARYGS